MRQEADDDCRATAETINQNHTQWLVIWGCYSRLYWAYPLFEMRRRVIVHAGYPDALIARMDEAERKLRLRRNPEEGTEHDTRTR